MFMPLNPSGSLSSVALIIATEAPTHYGMRIMTTIQASAITRNSVVFRALLPNNTKELQLIAPSVLTWIMALIFNFLLSSIRKQGALIKMSIGLEVIGPPSIYCGLLMVKQMNCM